MGLADEVFAANGGALEQPLSSFCTGAGQREVEVSLYGENECFKGLTHSLKYFPLKERIFALILVGRYFEILIRWSPEFPNPPQNRQ